ncbi:MAG TPA: S53 family peptidase [Trebonia sp.]|jgi:subtilase family serine protease|nr:S53 family peptidase [Trebonia sp.]
MGKSLALAAAAGVLAAAFVAAGTPNAPAATRLAVRVDKVSKASQARAVKPGLIEFGTGMTSFPSTAECVQGVGVACYSPSQLQRAYDEGPLFKRGIEGKGETIVIVDSFGSPTIRNDLAVFDKQFKLPTPSLKIIAPDPEKIPKWNAGNSDMTGWGAETTLDVEWSHAIAPKANILLVEVPVSETEGVHGFPQIVEAEDYVVTHHLGDVISQSFGATEQTFPGGIAEIKKLRLRNSLIEAKDNNVTVLASSGDAGATDLQTDQVDYYLHPVTSWPASDPYVTAVGGTEIKQGGDHSYYSVAWNDTFTRDSAGTPPSPVASGGGRSVFFARPSYQNGAAVQSVVGTQRGVPDIAMSAACSGTVLVYESFPVEGRSPGWYPICGTSEAAPQFAGIVALADQVAGHRLGLINQTLYNLSARKAPGIVDVTSGNNTVQFTQGAPAHAYTVQGWNAGPGYNLVDGVGTVNAAYLVYELAHKPIPG